MEGSDGDRHDHNVAAVVDRVLSWLAWTLHIAFVT